MNGIINVNKPPGMTSSDVVGWMRKQLKTKRIGHTGTLDPGVSGVLPICVGQATRLAEYLTDQGKSYKAEITFGITTDTQDSFGNTLKVSRPVLQIEDLKKIIPQFLGKVKQIPPMYSAVRKEGKHLYEYARQGIEIERASREINIYKLELIEWVEGEFPKAVLQVDCSKGTYIRTLCYDIGEALGYGAHMSQLLRTRSGPFSLEYSWTLEQIEAAVEQNNYAFLLELTSGLELPSAEIPAWRIEAFNNGLPTREAEVAGADCQDGIHVQVYSEGKFLGIGIWRDQGLYPHKVFKTL